MANIGLRKTYIAKISGNSYTGLAALSHAVSTEITPNYAEGSLYGDDMKVEDDREFTDASISLGVTTLPMDFRNTMFGHAISDDGVTYSKDDESNFVGYGTIGVEKVDGVKKYVPMFLPKCKFYEPAESAETRGDNIAYRTPSINGTGFALDNGIWKYTHVCDSESEAITWLETKFGAGLLGTFSAFSTSGTYAVGDYVTYSDDLYRCIKAIGTAGSWDETNWIKVAEAVSG